MHHGIEGMEAGKFLLYDDKSRFLTFERLVETFGSFFICKNVFKGGYSFISFIIWIHFSFLTPVLFVLAQDGDIFMLFATLAFCQTVY